MARPTDEETTATEKPVCYAYSSQEEGARHIVGGHAGKHQGGSEAGVGGAVSKSLYCGFGGKEW